MPLIESRREGGVVWITLNDGARSNLLSSALCTSLIQAVRTANEDAEARVIVIRAHGKAFCAGADLEDLKAAARGETAAVQQVYDAFLTVADSPLPTIAMVQGAAVGAGMNLALACDVRLVSGAARFDTRFLQIGLHPGGGHAWMLHRAVGWQQAARLLLLGRVIEAQEAVEIGLAAARYGDAEIEAAVRAECERAAATPRELLLRTKASLRLALQHSHRQAYEHETAAQMWSLDQPAFTELVANLQRRLAARGEGR